MQTHQHKTPFFSIITATRNSAEYIGRNLKVTGLQHHVSLEHILVDGNSTDGTWQMIQRYKRKCTYPVRIMQTEPRGISDAFNTGIREAKGKYILFMNSDDWLYDPDVLRDVKNFLQQNAHYDWIYGKICERNYIRNTANVFPETFIFHLPIPAFVKIFNYIPHQAAFYSSRLFQRFGYYDETLSSLMDIEFTYRIASKTKWKFINRIIANYSVRMGADSSDPRNKKKVMKNLDIIRGKHLNSVEMWLSKYLYQKLVQ